VRVRAYIQTDEVAIGGGATSSQARSASAALLVKLSPAQQPHPHPPSFATRTTGAPHEGLPFAPLSARSLKHMGLEDNPVRNRRQA
jgi:hypothetical protein